MATELCVCGHTADEHDVNELDLLAECEAPECPCLDFVLDPETQTAPEVSW